VSTEDKRQLKKKTRKMKYWNFDTGYDSGIDNLCGDVLGGI
jgi:hypothetical protein